MHLAELSRLFYQTLNEIADLRLQDDGITHYHSTYRYGLGEKQRYLASLRFVNSMISSLNYKAKILDVGCDIGLMSIMFNRIGLEVSAIDKRDPPSQGRYYGKRLKKIFSDNNIAFKKCNLLSDSLPFPDESFDFVYMGAVFEHLPLSHKQVIQEIKRVLRSGGYLIMDTPNIAFLVNRVRLLFGKSFMWPIDEFYNSNNFEGHFREFTLQEMQSMLNYSSLKVVQARTLDYSLRPVLKYERLNWKKRVLITLAFFVSRAASPFLPWSRPCLWVVAQKID